MILLSNTTEILELLTSAAVSTDYYVTYADHTSTLFTPGQANGNISTATTTTIVSAPDASTQRQVKFISIRNRSTSSSQTVTIKHDTSGTERYLTADVNLAPGDVLQYNDGSGFKVYDKTGREKTAATEFDGYSGFTFDFYKIGTASEAIGVRYANLKDSGFPSAWNPGTPGANGVWVDASVASSGSNPVGASQAGAPHLPNPATGSYYLQSDTSFAVSTAHSIELYDLIWYNTGIVVTTTTAQTISMPGTGKPSRDLWGGTNGYGWNAGIYVTTATTNAGAITNTTLSYTATDGTAGRTATIASFPATAVAGTLVPFQLAAGDLGMRSIESITLGTTYGGGAISVVLYRKLLTFASPVANVGSIRATGNDSPGIRLYNGTALFTGYLSSATTATNLSGTVSIRER